MPDEFEHNLEIYADVIVRVGLNLQPGQRLMIGAPIMGIEGTPTLGEVALVPHSSPISQTGLLFYNILFDENASNHLALGDAYRFSMREGEGMTADGFAAAGGNESAVHVDFMIGSAEMDVDGIAADGSLEPILRQGEWAFEA